MTVRLRCVRNWGAAVRSRVRAAGIDRGSTLVLMIGCFMLAGVLLTGGIAASAAFLAQRDLQSMCDGAAIAGAQAFQRPEAGAAVGDSLPLSQDAVVEAVADYAVDRYGAAAAEVTMGASTDGRLVRVTCSRVVHIPFEDLFSPGGLERTAVAEARSPLIP